MNTFYSIIIFLITFNPYRFLSIIDIYCFGKKEKHRYLKFIEKKKNIHTTLNETVINFLNVAKLQINKRDLFLQL